MLQANKPNDVDHFENETIVLTNTVYSIAFLSFTRSLSLIIVDTLTHHLSIFSQIPVAVNCLSTIMRPPISSQTGNAETHAYTSDSRERPIIRCHTNAQKTYTRKNHHVLPHKPNKPHKLVSSNLKRQQQWLFLKRESFSSKYTLTRTQGHYTRRALGKSRTIRFPSQLVTERIFVSLP